MSWRRHPPGSTGRPGVRLVAGGERRQDSVQLAFAAVAAECDIVLVHDAARPFVTADVISRAIHGARKRTARRSWPCR